MSIFHAHPCNRKPVIRKTRLLTGKNSVKPWMNFSKWAEFEKRWGPQDDRTGENESEAHDGSRSHELEKVPYVRECDCRYVTYHKQGNRQGDEPGGVCWKGRPFGEEELVYVRPEGKVEEREDEHQVQGIAKPDSVVEEGTHCSGARASVKIDQDVGHDRVPEKKVAEDSNREVDDSAEQQRYSHRWYHVGGLPELEADRVDCRKVRRHHQLSNHRVGDCFEHRSSTGFEYLERKLFEKHMLQKKENG